MKSTIFIQLQDCLEWLQIIKFVLWNFALIQVLPFLNNPKDLDLDFGVSEVKKIHLITKEIRNNKFSLRNKNK